MAIAQITPRDRLQRMVDLGKKTLRFWWLVAGLGVIGGAISLTFALTRARHYESSSVLYYQERIQSSILSNRQEEVQRNLGDRFRELLLSRSQLAVVLADPKLDAFPGVESEVAIDRLRSAIRFDVRGGNNFRITYVDVDPDRAKAVTDKLTKLLQDKDEALRNDQAQMTVSFVTQQKEEASIELKKREQALAEFLAKHPEFAQDNTQIGGEGGAIRASTLRNNQKPTATGNARLYALERQRQRIQARLEASPDSPPIRIASPPSPEKIAAEAAVTEAQRELNAANRELEDAIGKYTDKHPTVIKAQERVTAAQQRLRHAQANVPPDIETTLPPATAADRTKLQKELATLESQIADEQHSSSKGTNAGSADAAVTASTNWVVQLETQHADLRRQLNEQRERVGSLADSVFRAQIDASQKLAEQGGRLSIVDSAFRPSAPSGPGKTIFLLAGLVLFLGLGGALAIGLAIIDDRLYRRDDIDQIGIAVLAVIPPAIVHHRKRST
jgi:uncharacterized protein involved in exopolysaccharide biosynthesis